MKKYIKEVFTLGRIVALVSALLLGASALFPWAYGSKVMVTGLNGDGVMTICIGILAFIFLFIKRINILISLMLGLSGLLISLAVTASMQEAMDIISGQIGWGLNMTVIASIGIVIGTIIEIFQERNKKLKLYYLDD